MAAANWRTLKKLDAHIHILPDAVHRNLAEMKRRYPGRFYAFADIDVRNSRAKTVDALCRAIDDHALDGIKLHPNNSGLALDSDYNCAIFAFAQERRIPVAVHSYPNAEDDLSAA